MTIGEKLTIAARTGGSFPLTSDEAAAVNRAIDVLRRVRDNECTNPRAEAADILGQIDGQW